MPRLTALSTIASNLLSMSTFNFPPSTPPTQTTTPSNEARAAAPQIPVITFTAASQESHVVQRAGPVSCQQANTLRVPPRASTHQRRLQEASGISRGRSQTVKRLNLIASDTDAQVSRSGPGQTRSLNATEGEEESIPAQVGGSQAVYAEEVNAASSIAVKSAQINQPTPPFNAAQLKQELFLREIAKMRMEREMLRLQEQEIRLKRKRVQLGIEKLDEKIRLSRMRVARVKRRRLM